MQRGHVPGSVRPGGLQVVQHWLLPEQRILASPVYRRLPVPRQVPSLRMRRRHLPGWGQGDDLQVVVRFSACRRAQGQASRSGSAPHLLAYRLPLPFPAQAPSFRTSRVRSRARTALSVGHMYRLPCLMLFTSLHRANQCLPAIARLCRLLPHQRHSPGAVPQGLPLLWQLRYCSMRLWLLPGPGGPDGLQGLVSAGLPRCTPHFDALPAQSLPPPFPPPFV